VPPLTAALSCPFAVDGHSHFPVFLADTSAFGPGGPIDGKYQFRVAMLDATNNGWSITVSFTVKKECSEKFVIRPSVRAEGLALPIRH
jgi:hypothetical protein